MKKVIRKTTVSSQLRAQRANVAAGQCRAHSGRPIFRGSQCQECYDTQKVALDARRVQDPHLSPFARLLVDGPGLSRRQKQFIIKSILDGTAEELLIEATVNERRIDNPTYK